MIQTCQGTVKRDRKRGGGKMYVHPSLVQLVKDLAPEWQGFSGNKVANMFDRALPACPRGPQAICFALPGGKKTAHIPLLIEEDPAGNSIHINTRPDKKIIISDII